MALDDNNQAPGAMPDIEKRFSRGELTADEGPCEPDYGPRNERIPEKYRNELKSLCQKVAHRDMFARIDEVKRAGRAGFYWRNIFDAIFDSTNGLWEWAGNGVTGDTTGGDSGGLSYDMNIYQSRGRSFIKIIGHAPEVHFVASGQAPMSYRVAEAANHLFEQTASINDMEDLAQNVARIFWTDGRCALYTRWVTDGGRFGYYDQDYVDEVSEGLGEGGDPPAKQPREPKGGVVVSSHGVPEVKVPVNMRNIHEFPWLQLSREIDIASAKALYPDIAGQMHAGETGPGEYEFDRTTRIALTQGVHLISQMAESLDQLPTLQCTWMRPSFFAEVSDVKCRTWLMENFPDGAKVMFVGDTYAESCNESMDDHWDVCYPIVGHGQTTPAYGYSMLTAQDLFNDLIDLEMETHMRAIPAVYFDPSIFDMAASSKERAQPGARYALKHDIDPQMNVQQHVWAEPQISVTQQELNLRDSIMGPISDIITGISAAAVGQSDESNQTMGGISILRAASRGEAGTAFTQFLKAYTRAAEKAVRIDAYYRLAEADEDGILTVRKPNSPDILIDLADLREGNFWCKPDCDQSVPSTFEEKQMGLAGLVNAAMQGADIAKQVLADPKNAGVFLPLFGVPGLHSASDEAMHKQMAEIEELLAAEPIPNPQAMMIFQVSQRQAMATGQPMPEPDKYQLFQPSLKTGKFDDDQAEFVACSTWINSAAGQRNQIENPYGFFNVELHALEHQNKAQQQAMQAQQQSMAGQLALEQSKHPPKQPKSPTESINFKDLGPSGRIQLAAQAGLDVSADASADTVEEHMHPSPPPAPKLKRQR